MTTPAGITSDTVISNDFTTTVFGIDVFRADTSTIKRLFNATVKLRIDSTTGSQGGKMLFYSFMAPDDLVKFFYKPGEGFYVDSAVIRSSHFVLNKKVHAGMEKAELLKLLGLKGAHCDRIVVLDDEYTRETVFLFRDGKLAETLVNQTLEDD